MYMAKQNITIDSFFKNHLLQIIILTIGVIVAFNTMNHRVSALENKVAEYPEQRWFELKFEMINDAIDKNTQAIEECFDLNNK